MTYDHLNGNGSTVTFSPSGFLAEVKSMNEPPESIEVLDKTHLASAYMERRAGKVRNLGDMSMTINYDPDNFPPIAIEQNITLQYISPDGIVAGAKVEFVGFISNWEPGEIVNDTVTEATITITVKEDVVRTPSGGGGPP
ncbi:MAG: hypothetical protein HRU15_20620 [Planctomycetes bacterium]|nr:hypothetical protein [Planctomycetota bacterium]